MLNRPMALLFGLYRGGNRYDIHFERFAEPGPAHGRERAALADQLDAPLRRAPGALLPPRALQLVQLL